ncbi:MAG TPA: acyl carrier protein [Myxococcota bacterium]|nr:acyl carrier protein [Myxococcota bacterium]
MTDTEVLGLIRDALNEVEAARAGDWATLSLDQTIEALELGSVAIMEMIGVIEERTDKTFPDEALPKINTLRDLANLIQKGSL